MEEKKKVPELRFPGFEDDWEEKKLGDIVSINPKVNNMPPEFIYIDLESVISGILIQKNYINLADAPSRAQRVLSKGDILFQMVRPYQKNNYFFDLNDSKIKYVASTGYAQIRTVMCSKFFYCLFHTTKFVNEVINKCTGTSYPAINSTDLGAIDIFQTIIPEQTKIANFLSDIDLKIEKLTKKKELMVQYKKGMMQTLFSQEIRFKDENGNESV